MKVLVICDDFWHPGGIPQEGLDALAKSTDWSFDYIYDGGEWSEKKMAAYDLAVFVKSDNTTQADKTPWVTSEVETYFQEWVAGGKGLLAMHSGTVYKEGHPTMRGLIGGAFDHHPKQCSVTCQVVADHPITAGVDTAWTQVDEHYHMVYDADRGNDLFMTCWSEHGTQPGGWTRTEGEGKVVVLTPGHNAAVWLDANYQRMIDNALIWLS